MGRHPQLNDELGARYLYEPMRVAPGGQVELPRGMLDLINVRLRYAFGEMVQCGMGRYL